MKLLKNEEAVTEVVGAMLVLLISVLYLGTMQTYEVPKWNKELEKEQFDKIYDDFMNLRSDLEDVSTKNIPKTSNLHMGIRYPERFMLHNPGTGASGTLTTYPLNITIRMKEAGSANWKNYTINSTGIEYQLRGISTFPKLVYEHGIIIEDFGTTNYSIDEKQSLITNDSIYIPIFTKNKNSVSSTDMETFNLQPIPDQYYSSKRFSSLNVTLETRYPDVWAKWFTIGNKTNCSDVATGYSCIKITNIPGFDVLRLTLTNTDQLSQDQMYMSRIAIDNDMATGIGTGSCKEGQDMWTKNQMCTNLPASNNVSQFVIRNITTERLEEEHDEHEEEHDEHEGEHDAYEEYSHYNEAELKFSVKDVQSHLWTVDIKFKNESSLEIDGVKQKYPYPGTSPYCSYNTLFNGRSLSGLGGVINLTPCYRNASISTPNVLIIDKMENIIYANFIIN